MKDFKPIPGELYRVKTAEDFDKTMIYIKSSWVWSNEWAGFLDGGQIMYYSISSDNVSFEKLKTTDA